MYRVYVSWKFPGPQPTSGWSAIMARVERQYCTRYPNDLDASAKMSMSKLTTTTAARRTAPNAATAAHGLQPIRLGPPRQKTATSTTPKALAKSALRLLVK